MHGILLYVLLTIHTTGILLTHPLCWDQPGGATQDGLAQGRGGHQTPTTTRAALVVVVVVIHGPVCMAHIPAFRGCRTADSRVMSVCGKWLHLAVVVVVDIHDARLQVQLSLAWVGA